MEAWGLSLKKIPLPIAIGRGINTKTKLDFN